MPKIESSTPGGFYIARVQQPLDCFRSDKVRALLVYVSLAGGRLLWRKHLAQFLWAGYEPQTALASSRMAFNNLCTPLT
jgi:DNA-binding SARP family transcriptional activator